MELALQTEDCSVCFTHTLQMDNLRSCCTRNFQLVTIATCNLKLAISENQGSVVMQTMHSVYLPRYSTLALHNYYHKSIAWPNMLNLEYRSHVMGVVWHLHAHQIQVVCEGSFPNQEVTVYMQVCIIHTFIQYNLLHNRCCYQSLIVS